MLTVLIRPPTLSSKNDAFQGPIPPLGLAYVAASLEKAGFSVQVVDAVGEAMDKFKLLEDFPDILKNGLDHEEILQRIPLEAKLIGISCMFSQDWPPIRSLFNLIRSHFPNATLVAGGEHVTSCPEYVLKDCPSIDCCVLGEGEETIVDLAQSVKKKGSIEEIPGLAFRKNKVTVRTKPRERIRQIASISWPAWHLFPLEIYLRTAE